MERGFDTNIIGKSFDKTIIDAVWEKATKYDNSTIDPKHVRKDKCGTPIAKGDYGKQEKYGWEIDHIKPVSKGGTDDLSNLQPLYWETNRKKEDKYPWDCSML